MIEKKLKVSVPVVLSALTVMDMCTDNHVREPWVMLMQCITK
jgi:hypothetical protein